ncbi:MAG: TIGR04086 family membrane protein [Actinomycetota bacterium]|nr:TIGR04086 family membrane protein [Actinomycetota bacterium]
MTTYPRDPEPGGQPAAGNMGQSVPPHQQGVPGERHARLGPDADRPGDQRYEQGVPDERRGMPGPDTDRPGDQRHDQRHLSHADSGATDLTHTGLDHKSVRAREKEAFGGIKFGSAFFGWLTTVGATVLLVAIGTAIATAINADNELSTQDLRNAGIGAAIGLLVILFIAYFIGGYVAGRMARFNGARQGFAVWLWAVIIAIILTIVGVIVGNETDIIGPVNLPDIPVDSGDLTAGGLIALAAVLVVTLVAAILGGLAGMRFHRRVDRAGFDTSLDRDDDGRRLDRHDDGRRLDRDADGRRLDRKDDGRRLDRDADNR